MDFITSNENKPSLLHNNYMYRVNRQKDMTELTKSFQKTISKAA